jgi:hypothetical protein
VSLISRALPGFGAYERPDRPPDSGSSLHGGFAGTGPDGARAVGGSGADSATTQVRNNLP